LLALQARVLRCEDVRTDIYEEAVHMGDSTGTAILFNGTAGMPRRFLAYSEEPQPTVLLRKRLY